MPEPTVTMITCAGGCKQAWPADDIERSGWSLLPITNRYRCGQCTRELAEAGREQPQPEVRDAAA